MGKHLLVDLSCGVLTMAVGEPMLLVVPMATLHVMELPQGGAGRPVCTRIVLLSDGWRLTRPLCQPVVEAPSATVRSCGDTQRLPSAVRGSDAGSVGARVAAPLP